MSADRDTMITAIAAAFYDRDPELSRVIVGQVLEAATACGYRVVGPAEQATWETIASELYKHLKALNVLLYAERYSERGPCAGCYDAQYAYETFIASPAAGVAGSTNQEPA